MSVFVFIALFDYHWTQILCEVEKQATCMPMSPSCLSNSGHLETLVNAGLAIAILVKLIKQEWAEAIKSIQRSKYTLGFNLPGTYQSMRGVDVSLRDSEPCFVSITTDKH